MDTINKLENAIGVFFKAMPHLPKNGQKWLATKMYSIQRILLLLAVLGFISAGALLSIFVFPMSSYFGVPMDLAPAYDVSGITSNIMALASLAITIILTASAIKPLKQMKKYGWDLLFIMFLLGVLYLILDFIISPNVTVLLINVVFTLISAYVLFEIRSFFGKTSAKK